MNDMLSQVWQGKPKLTYMRIRAPSLSICLIRNMGKTNESEVGKQKYLPAPHKLPRTGVGLGSLSLHILCKAYHVVSLDSHLIFQ